MESEDQDLLRWLQQQRLDKFQGKLVELGCEKMDHLNKEDDLKSIGFLPIQIRGFNQQRRTSIPHAPVKAQPSPASSSMSEKKHVLVHMPSTAFGHAVTSVRAEKLAAKYPDLYYTVPQNCKHQACN